MGQSRRFRRAVVVMHLRSQITQQGKELELHNMELEQANRGLNESIAEIQKRIDDNQKKINAYERAHGKPKDK